MQQDARNALSTIRPAMERREGQGCEDADGGKQQDVGREFHEAVVDELGKT
jgi:hypothetical protein